LKNFLIIVLLLICSHLQAKPDIVISDGFVSLSAGQFFSIYKDHTSSATAEKIIEEDLTKSFTRPATEELNFGYTLNNIWCYTEIYNASQKHKELVFEVSTPHIDEFKLYLFKDKTIVDSFYFSQNNRSISTTLQYKHILVPIEMEPGEKVSVLLSEFNNGDSLSLPCMLWNAKDFYKSASEQNIFLGITFGIIFFIILINIYLIFISKLKSSINFLIFACCAFISLLNCEGLTYIFPGWLNWFSTDSAIIFFFLTAIVFFLNFFENINTEGDKIIHRHWLIFGIKVTSTILAISALFGYPFIIFAAFGASIITPVTYLSVITISILNIRKKKRINWLILISIGFPWILLQIFFLKDLNIIEGSNMINHAPLVAFTAQILLFFLLFLDLFRRNQIKTSKDLANKTKLMEKQKLDLQIAMSNLEKLSLIAQETDNCIVIFDNRGHVNWINDSFKRIYSKGSSELNKSLSNFTAIYSGSNKAHFEKCIAQKESIKFESQQLTGTNEIRWSQITLTPSLGSENEVSEVIAIEADITEIKQMQIMLHNAKEKAEEGSKLKTAFLSNISHELRTPLNGIIGFSDLILDKYELDSKLSKFISLIKENGHNLLSLICDLLDVSRIEAGAITINNRSFDSNGLLEEIYQHTEKIISREKPHINIYKEFEVMNRDIFSDRTKIKQILINFVNNAIKFTHEGYIKIGFKTYKDSYIFFVEDSGIGIGNEEAKVIFKRFRQSDDSATREYGGVGIGLTISSGLAKLLNAKINFRSQKGKGTTFFIEIPIDHVHNMDFQVSQGIADNIQLLENTKILTIFNSETDFSLVDTMLKKYKPLCFFAKNTEDAIFRLQKGMTPDIIIADIQPQERDSLTFVSHIKHLRPQAGLIGVAMISSDKEIKMATDAGCNAVISKPPEPPQLISAIVELLKAKKEKAPKLP